MHAVIVDHALRAESQQIAASAAHIAAQHGAQVEIVRLSWAGPPKGQAAWRRARLAALCAAARRLGAAEIALGHTADDQAETVAMRLAAGTGWRGLAGMAARAPAPIWPEGRGLLLHRPLLAARRADLRTKLRGLGAQWLEDPANANSRFARVRARAKLAQTPALRAHLLAIAGLAARAAKAVDSAVHAALDQAVDIQGGLLTFAWQNALAQPLPVQHRLMACLLTAASGREVLCGEVVAARSLQRVILGESHSAAGVRVHCRHGDAVLARDPGAVRGRGRNPQELSAALSAGRVQVWDNRLECKALQPGWTVAPDKGGRPILIHAEMAPLGLEIGDAGAPWAHWLVSTRLQALLWRAGK